MELPIFPAEIWLNIATSLLSHRGGLDAEPYYVLVRTSKEMRATFTPLNMKVIFARVAVDRRVTVFSLPNGFLHREDGPAKIYACGREEWYQHNKRHRDNGPAIMGANGGESWYQRGKLHRTGGPAIIDRYGDSYWYQYGEYVDTVFNRAARY